LSSSINSDFSECEILLQFAFIIVHFFCPEPFSRFDSLLRANLLTRVNNTDRRQTFCREFGAMISAKSQLAICEPGTIFGNFGNSFLQFDLFVLLGQFAVELFDFEIVSGIGEYSSTFLQ